MTSDGIRGTIIEIRPKALYRVRLIDGQVITASVESKLRHVIVRILVDQEVIVRLSAHDPHRGQIIQIAP